MTNALDRLRTLSVSDVMAKGVVWVDSQKPMADVAAQLLHHEISSAPVVDEKGICVGMISASDFLRRDSDEQNGKSAIRRAWTPADVAATFMSTGVQTVPAHVSIFQAAKIMCNQHIHRLPVVNHQGHPVGIVSTMDIVAALNNAAEEMNAG